MEQRLALRCVVVAGSQQDPRVSKNEEQVSADVLQPLLWSRYLRCKKDPDVSPEAPIQNSQETGGSSPASLHGPAGRAVPRVPWGEVSLVASFTQQTSWQHK